MSTTRNCLGVLVLTILVAHCAAQRCGREFNFALCGDGSCCSKWGYCGYTNEHCGTGCQSGPCSGGGGGSGLSSILTRSFFENSFPRRNGFYTYDSFINAANSFPQAGFGTTGNNDQKKREVAAFLAHIDHETTGLIYIEEINPGDNYCDENNQGTWRCAPGKSYHGRGPLQLSWQYNYGMCGQAIGVDLLSNPERVAQDATIAFKTAIWFWSTPQWNKPSAHAVMTGGWNPSGSDTANGRQVGFGVTTNIINGGKECGWASPQAASRVQKYRNFCSTLGVDPGQNLDCNGQRPF